MQIRSSFSIAEAERLIAEMSGRTTDTTVTFPTNSRGHLAGGEAAVTQAIVTWAQAQSRARVATYAIDEDDPQVGKLTRHLAGLCTALMADEAVDRDGRAILPVLRVRAGERLREVQGAVPERGSRGPQIEIVCADHLGRSAPRTLYDERDGRDVLRKRIAFDEVARLIVRETVPENLARDLDERFDAALADTLYELFRNTDEYARVDDRGNRPTKSIRGIQARRNAIAPDQLLAMVTGSAPLVDYCERQRARPGKQHLQLLEVSVFDSGPGFAAHWLKRPAAEIGREEERDAVLTCFEKHATSKANKTAGMGLTTVVDVLRRNEGFLRIRTGRQSLYCDLGLERDLDSAQAAALRPWHDRPLPRAAGTLITFMMPL